MTPSTSPIVANAVSMSIVERDWEMDCATTTVIGWRSVIGTFLSTDQTALRIAGTRVSVARALRTMNVSGGSDWCWKKGRYISGTVGTRKLSCRISPTTPTIVTQTPLPSNAVLI